jgi:hypothetical protein
VELQVWLYWQWYHSNQRTVLCIHVVNSDELP